MNGGAEARVGLSFLCIPVTVSSIISEVLPTEPSGLCIRAFQWVAFVDLYNNNNNLTSTLYPCFNFTFQFSHAPIHKDIKQPW